MLHSDGTKTSYFRGRKLHGKAVQLPAGYRGVVVEKHAPAQPEPGQEVIDLEEEDEQFPLGSLETKAEFEEVVVWGHEVMADEASDPYVRIGEWTRLAEQVSCLDDVDLLPFCLFDLSRADADW